MVKKLLSLVVTAALCGATAATANAMTVSLGTPSISGRVAITEPVTVSCSVLDPSLIVYSDYVSVSVEQASGTAIARGFGAIGGSLPNLPFACDGSTHTVPVSISADPLGPPFHGGPAVFTASATADEATPCFPGSIDCLYNFTGQTAATGPTPLVLH